MKRLFRLLLLPLLLSMVMAVDVSAQQAFFNRITMEHNYYRNGTKGMMIHTDWNINYAVGRQVELTWFFYFDNGQPLMDGNGRHRAPDGQVAFTIWVTPRYQETHYGRTWYFVPYSELHLGPGYHNLMFNVQAFVDGRLVGRSNDVRFYYNK